MEDRLRSRVQTFAFTIGANGISSFLPVNPWTSEPIWMIFGSIIGGPRRIHSLFFRGRFFAQLEKSTIFVKNLDFFAEKRAKVQLRKFEPLCPLGSPYNAIEILTLTPENFGKLGKNFFSGWVALWPLGTEG